MLSVCCANDGASPAINIISVRITRLTATHPCAQPLTPDLDTGSPRSVGWGYPPEVPSKCRRWRICRVISPVKAAWRGQCRPLASAHEFPRLETSDAHDKGLRESPGHSRP